MKKSLSLFLCILAALLALSACGAKEPPREEEPAPREESRIPENERDAAPAEPAAEPDPEPEPFVTYAEANGIQFEKFQEVTRTSTFLELDGSETEVKSTSLEANFTFQTRDYQDTEDIALEGLVMEDSGFNEGIDKNVLSFSASVFHDLEQRTGYLGNIYLFDVYTGIALPSPAPVDSSAGGSEHYEWEQTVTVDGTEYPLSVIHERSTEIDRTRDWFNVQAPSGFNRLGLIVTSSNVDVTEPIDISNYISEGDNVYYFMTQVPETQG